MLVISEIANKKNDCEHNSMIDEIKVTYSKEIDKS